MSAPTTTRVETVSYRTESARAGRAFTAIERAEARLMADLYAAFPDGDFPYADDVAMMATTELFRQAGQRINAAVREAKTREGIGAYVPYGRPVARRW